MNEKARQALIAFLAVPEIGRQTMRKISAWCDDQVLSLDQLWEDSRNWAEAGFTKTQIEELQKFQKRFSLSGYFDYLASKSIRVMTIDDKNYPDLLNEIDDPPLALYIKGNFPAPICTPISVVGTRKVTSYGRLATEKIVTELVGLGATVISGFMYGVDFLAHQSALVGGGQTIGVLGFGFEHFYPSVYQKKYQEMLSQGMCFVSEYAPFVRPTHGSFPERNRIVAGMSLGTVVIEAGEQSGTLITAGLAGEFGRSIFAVPGSIFSPYSVGTKNLLNQGACLVGSGQEIMSELGLEICRPFNFEQLGAKIRGLGNEIIEELKKGPADFAHLSSLLHQPTADLSSTLSQLEIEGLVVCSGEIWTLKY